MSGCPALPSVNTGMHSAALYGPLSDVTMPALGFLAAILGGGAHSSCMSLASYRSKALIVNHTVK
jgi:hypothetical protein